MGDGFSDSHASTFDPKEFVPERAESVASSNLEISADLLMHEELPPAPVIPEACDEFPCPYCFYVMNKHVFSSKKRWRLHVEQDLQPYVCIYPDCLAVQRAFGSIPEWNQHINDSHLALWVCSLCDESSPNQHSPGRLPSSEELATHLDQNHGSLSNTQRRSLLKKGRRSAPGSAAFESCPFCSLEFGKDDQPRCREHVANHLLSLSLLCLPDRSDLHNPDEFVTPGDEVEVTPQVESELALSFEERMNLMLSRGQHSSSARVSESVMEGSVLATTLSETFPAEPSSAPTQTQDLEEPHSEASQWTWSVSHGDYYYVTYDESGNPVYHWTKSNAPLQQQLDPSYHEARTWSNSRIYPQVFAILWSEAAGKVQARSAAYSASDISAVRFQQGVYSQIRRFAVVAVKRGFVYACAISTYSKRGTLKPGCNAAEHSVIYLSGSQPSIFEGEIQNGLSKEPIEIQPADSTVHMDPSCRLRFGKTYPVEMNVKVKDIGRVVPHHMSKFIRYWREEDRLPDSEDEEEGDETPQVMQTPGPTQTLSVKSTPSYNTHGTSAYYDAHSSGPYNYPVVSGYTQGDAIQGAQSAQQNAGYPSHSDHTQDSSRYSTD
ncbi:hypothetical protein K491DRAFT_711899 [Lophiostoma macrostomum CBS 122681]|uniref:DUF6590 domain-containing protein n=1 Tax=Lophiostoma macrostomum CBS 122681 TaxID=1314788 RepID=A0A6A6TN81_9PLEO|nr:hypothetical protein K491DRAFT_711899 [Lophiostoma macrostomum CBS 122681]